MSDVTYDDILAVQQAIEDADVPTEHRYMRISKHAYLALGGRLEDWQKLQDEQDGENG